MGESLDLHAEAQRWIATKAPRHELLAALDSLISRGSEALGEETRLVDELRRDLVYALCWPEGIGDETLVGRAYLLMGQVRFPIPDDPEPIRQALRAHEDRHQRLSALLRDARALRELLAA